MNVETPPATATSIAADSSLPIEDRQLRLECLKLACGQALAVNGPLADRLGVPKDRRDPVDLARSFIAFVDGTAADPAREVRP